MEHNNLEACWAKLIPELLSEIAKLLYCYNDYAHLRAVCKHWNTSLPKIPNNRPYPWLVLPFDDDKAIYDSGVAEHKIYHIILPEFQNIKLRGSSFGWLIGVGIDGTVRMLNPLTKRHINLPPLSTFPDVVSYDEKHGEYRLIDSRNGVNYPVDGKHMQKTEVKKIILSCPPDDDTKQEDFMAIAIYGSCQRLAFCRHGDKKWTDLPKLIDDDESQANYYYNDVIFHEGKIYVIDTCADAFEYDMKAKPTPVGVIVEATEPYGIFNPYINDGDLEYLIGCPNGDLLRLIRNLKCICYHRRCSTSGIYRTIGCDIYKLVKETKQWLPVSKLNDDWVLLIGCNSSICMPALSIPIGHGNQIHYTDNLHDRAYNEIVGGHDIGMLNLEDGSITQLFPNSILLSSPPIWLV